MLKVQEQKEYKVMPKNYEELIVKYPLKPIKNECENNYYLKVYEEISDLYIENPEIEYLEDYLEALAILIEKFEEKAYPIPKASSVEVLKFLMEQHDLRQIDLIDIFKTPSILSEILSGKRNYTVEHIRKLSERFNVSADAFI